MKYCLCPRCKWCSFRPRVREAEPYGGPEAQPSDPVQPCSPSEPLHYSTQPTCSSSQPCHYTAQPPAGGVRPRSTTQQPTSDSKQCPYESPQPGGHAVGFSGKSGCRSCCCGSRHAGGSAQLHRISDSTATAVST